MNETIEWELYIIVALTCVTAALIIHTIRYYKAKKRMLKHMTRFAKEGDAEAGFYVAEEFRKGDVVKKRCDQALFWYHKSALRGHEDAKKYVERISSEGKNRC